MNMDSMKSSAFMRYKKGLKLDKGQLIYCTDPNDLCYSTKL